MSALTSLAHLAVAAGAAPARARLTSALRDPASAQRAVLRRVLARGAPTAYGRAHDFHRIRDERDFAERVPLTDYDTLRPWIERIGLGEARVLTTDPVRFMEPTGGSAGASKLVPYTSSLIGEFSQATSAWLFDLLTHRPAIGRGPVYWAVTPPGRRPTHTEGGLPIGMEDDAEYFPRFLRPLLRRTLAVPASVAARPSLSVCRYLTLRALVGAPELSMISVWSPSFLTLLAEALDEHFPRVRRDLEHGTLSVALPRSLAARLMRALPAQPELARALHRRFGAHPPRDLGLLWPRLAMISCWTGGHAARALGAMRARFPHVEVQGKGLLATEGVISIPLFGASAPVAALTSHYLEFLDPRDARAIPAHLVDVGGTYEVALTTSGGLYRYRLRDLVRVEGRLHRAPMLSFQGRADRTSDVAGEKLTVALAERVIASAMRATGIDAAFAMLSPVFAAEPHYRLYVEASRLEADRLAQAVEGELLAAHHYALCRALGQLGPVRAVAVHDGARLYESACLARGQRAGTIKPSALEPEGEWDAAFEREPAGVLE